MRISDEVVTLTKKDFVSNKEAADLYNSSVRRFEGLVERGVASIRKNQLMPLEDRYKKQVKYNTN